MDSEFAKEKSSIEVRGACEHNLKDVHCVIPRGKITVITGVSGSGKSSLAFDTILAECQRRFFYTLSYYSRQFLNMSTRPLVRHISGLSPAIALAQNETQPTRRASVATLTDLGELLGVLFARFGEAICPTHRLPTASFSQKDIQKKLIHQFDGKLIALCVSISEKKKGTFRSQLTSLAEKGFLRVYWNGKVVPLNPIPDLHREEKHTIKLVIDCLRVKPQNLSRLERALTLCLEEGQGYGECYITPSPEELTLEGGYRFSTLQGCPTCGFSWPHFDSRYFSANSLGGCEDCSGLGVVEDGEELLEVQMENSYTPPSEDAPFCKACNGTGLKSDLQAVLFLGETVQSFHQMALKDLTQFFKTHAELVLKDNPAYRRLLEEIQGILARLMEMGLGYLHLARRLRTLSGGENQRLKLSGVLAENLRGVIYILDEPSQGLHTKEIQRLGENLQKLKALGNTLILVEHDDQLIKLADWIIDLGPSGGNRGGEILASFAPEDAKKFAKISKTARYLALGEHSSFTPSPSTAGFFSLRKCNLHNLKIPEVKFQKEALNVVTGVSGAGKTSLVLGTLFPRAKNFLEHGTKEGIDFPDLQEVALVDRSPLAKNSASMPATYLEIFTDIRKLYEQLPEAQILGFNARSFSLLAEGGRCEECRGKGEQLLQMRFLPDARVLCPICQGKRYKEAIDAVKLRGKSIIDVLAMPLDEALEFFKNRPKIAVKLQAAVDLGLGYLKLGQPSSSLSGGEAQRLKLAPYLAKKSTAGFLLLLDEPTRGLHFDDVECLLQALNKLIQLKATVVMIEHSQQIIQSCHWTVDLGPGSATEGGTLLYLGKPLL